MGHILKASFSHFFPPSFAAAVDVDVDDVVAVAVVVISVAAATTLCPLLFTVDLCIFVAVLASPLLHSRSSLGLI